MHYHIFAQREQKQKSNKVNGIRMIGIFAGGFWMNGKKVVEWRGVCVSINNKNM